MIEKFEYIGIWWLADKPENQIAGTLLFDPISGAVLKLIGSFRNITDINKTLVEPQIILGVTSNGKNITLNGCYENKTTFSMPGFQVSSLYISIIFEGVHFFKVDDIRFKNISVHYSHLDEWTNISGFDIQYVNREAIIKYKLPEPIIAKINDEYKINIIIGAKYPSHSIVQKEASISQKTYIKIEASEKKSLEEHLKIMYQIQNLLSLGIKEPVYPTEIEGEIEIDKGEKDKNNNKVKIFYKQMDKSLTSKTIFPHDMLFTFNDISGRFDIFLKNWFEKIDLLKPVFDLFFGTLYNSHMYIEYQFLSFAQAIESFHRRIYGGEYLKDEEYKKIYDNLIKSIPCGTDGDFKDSIKIRLKYDNEYSLRRRMNDISKQYQAITDEFIENSEVFIGKVVDTRNYLTHYDKDIENNIDKGEDLYHLTQKLKLLLETLLLKELGFSLEEIKIIFKRKNINKFL